jgi:hypothetical protein
VENLVVAYAVKHIVRTVKPLKFGVSAVIRNTPGLAQLSERIAFIMLKDEMDPRVSLKPHDVYNKPGKLIVSASTAALINLMVIELLAQAQQVGEM